MTDHPKGAILQRDKQTNAIVPRTPVGMLTPDDLESLASVARKYQIPVIKITSGQRFALVGIKKEDVERIFEPFEQVESSANRRFQGTGLGLSLTKSLVDLHGGKIWAESKGEGKGTSFIFRIPA